MGVWIAAVVAAHGQVHDNIKRLIERRRIRGPRRGPIGLRFIKMIIHIPVDGIGRPFQEIHVKVGGSVIPGKRVPSRRLKMAPIHARVMEGSPHHRGIVSPVFHDINFTTGRPAAVGRMFGHQPQRRPITLAPGKFRAKFEATVFLGKKPLAFQAG